MLGLKYSTPRRTFIRAEIVFFILYGIAWAVRVYFQLPELETLAQAALAGAMHYRGQAAGLKMKDTEENNNASI